MKEADYWIKQLDLIPHPEGGFYREIYKSSRSIVTSQFSRKQSVKRPLATSIYFFLKSGDISKFHRLKSDEIWYYHFGSSLTIHTIDIKGNLNEIQLGIDLEKGQVLQAVIPVYTIFGASVNELDSFSIVGCMVTPGFDFKDFELIERDFLLNKFPGYKDIIIKLT